MFIFDRWLLYWLAAWLFDGICQHCWRNGEKQICLILLIDTLGSKLHFIGSLVWNRSICLEENLQRLHRAAFVKRVTTNLWLVGVWGRDSHEPIPYILNFYLQHNPHPPTLLVERPEVGLLAHLTQQYMAGSSFMFAQVALRVFSGSMVFSCFLAISRGDWCP